MIGAARFFAVRLFAPRYWPKVGAAPALLVVSMTEVAIIADRTTAIGISADRTTAVSVSADRTTAITIQMGTT